MGVAVETQALGHQLRALRTAAGRTVASVAQEAGLSVPYVANLENGRGNPTTAALSRLSSALGMRLVITLAPRDHVGRGAVDGDVEMPASLVRLGRTPRFRRAVRMMSEALDQDPQEFAARLVGILAALADAVRTDPGEADWWRLLDALLLMTVLPETSRPAG